MGKNMYLKHVDDELENVNPSCMSGFINAIDFNHWHYGVKRALPHKRNQGRLAKGQGSPDASALGHDSAELQMLVHEEEKHLPVDREPKKRSSTNKRSVKSRIKALIAHHMTKEGSRRQRGSGFSSQSGLQRTYSIHHLEPPDHGLGEICTDWEHPIIFIKGNKDNGGTILQDTKNIEATEKSDVFSEKLNKLRNKDASKDKFKEDSDLLEMFKVDKEIFLDFLQNADGLRKTPRSLPASKAKAKLIKSGSFPAANLLQKRNTEPSKLEHKQSETWSSLRWEKFPAGTLMPKDVLKNSKNQFSKSAPSADYSRGTKLGRALSLILQSTADSDEEEQREIVVPSKESKQAVQFAVIEGKNETNSSSSSVIGEISNGHDCFKLEKDSDARCGDSTSNTDGEKSSCRSHVIDEYNSFIKNKVSHRRSSSLNDSLDKYALLFENSFRKEVALQPSKSLRLRNEDEAQSGSNAPMLFSRISSLPSNDFYSSIQGGWHEDANFADWPITSAEDSATRGDCGAEVKPIGFSTVTDKCIQPDDFQESGYHHEMLQRSDSIQEMDNLAGSRENITGECSTRMEGIPEENELTVGKSNCYKEQESNDLAIGPSKFPLPYPVSASESSFQDEVPRFMEFQSAKGVESRCDHLDEESSNNQQNSDAMASSPLFNSMPNLESIRNSDHLKDLRKSKSSKKDDTDFDYVKDILECSGLTKDVSNWKWHSSDQPLNPSVFEEIEAYWHQESECSSEDLFSCYDHQLLFDLVNEKLVHLYNRSSTYYPKVLSSSCRIHTFPVGNRIVEEICTSISTLMALNPEQMQSLDSVIDLDLKKDDGWMNLQLESECMALELEDIIFDDLLEEIMSS